MIKSNESNGVFVKNVKRPKGQKFKYFRNLPLRRLSRPIFLLIQVARETRNESDSERKLIFKRAVEECDVFYQSRRSMESNNFVRFSSRGIKSLKNVSDARERKRGDINKSPENFFVPISN